MPAIHIVPDRPKKAYRLYAQFNVDQFPSPGYLKRAELEAGLAFIRDMEKMGWVYMGRGLDLSKPRSHVPQKTVPKRSMQKADEIPSYVSDIPKLSQSPQWTYYLRGLFVRTEIPIDLGPMSIEERREYDPRNRGTAGGSSLSQGGREASLLPSAGRLDRK